MVRSAPFFVLACLLALTAEGLLWSSSHTGGAVEEPCRFAQVQVSSSEVYLSDVTSCFVLLALPYTSFTALHQHTHTGQPNNPLTTTAPTPRPLVLIKSSQQPEDSYPSTLLFLPLLHDTQTEAPRSMQLFASRKLPPPLHTCPHSTVARKRAQSLLPSPYPTSPHAPAPIPDTKHSCTPPLFPVRNTLTTGTCPGGWYLGTWDVPLGRFKQLKRSSDLKLPNSHQATHTRMTQPDSLPMQPSPKPTHIFPLHAGLPTGSRRNIHRSPRGRNKSGSQPGYHQGVRPASQSLRSDYGHKRQADGGNGGVS